jgi:hypothetical protein
MSTVPAEIVPLPEGMIVPAMESGLMVVPEGLSYPAMENV